MDDIGYLIPTPNTFRCIASASLKQILELSQYEARVVLPTLIRTCVCKGLDESNEFLYFKQEIQKKIRDFEETNFVSMLLNIDFKMVQGDAVKEQHLRSKVDGPRSGKSKMLGDISLKKLALEFEEGDPLKRTRIVLSELLRVKSEISDHNEFTLDDSELFQCVTYQQEISDVLCIAFAELPFLFSITELAEVLLRVKYGPLVLCNLLVNNPDYFQIVCSSILSHAKTTEEMDVETQVRTKALKMLCQMNPSYIRDLRVEGVTLCKLAGLVIELSIQTKIKGETSDIVPFFTGLLLASDSKTKDWIADYIKAAQKEHKENALYLFKRQLIKEMIAVIDILHVVMNSQKEAMQIDEEKKLDVNSQMMHGIAIMRLFCALKSTSGFKFTHDEVDILINLIICQTPNTQIGTRFVTVALCTLVASAVLLSTQERESKVTEWLKGLIDQPTLTVEGDDVSYREILLLIAIHFHANTLEPIVDLICTTLGIKIKLGSLTKIKVLFTQDVFPERVVAEHAVTVPVTKGLSKQAKGFLPVHCIHQLIKSRVFTKHDITVKPWIFKQLCSCTTPVHPLILQLIETYVNAIITSINISKTKNQRMNSLKPFNEEDIIAIFTDDRKFECDDRRTSQILFMLYVLTYQNALLTSMKNLYNNPKAPREYTTNLYSKIPMKQLLLFTRGDEQNYGDLYPPLLKYIVTYYPHLCLVEDWIDEEEIGSSSLTPPKDQKKVLNSTGAISSLGLDLDMVTRNPQKVIMKLIRLNMLQPNQLVTYTDTIIELLPVMLDQDTPRKIQVLVNKLWLKINTVNPESLWWKTVNILRLKLDEESAEWNKTSEYTNEEIQKDPLIVLRCDRRVYRCPPVFELLIRVLSGYLTASRALLNHHLLANPIISGGKSQQEIMMAQQEREDLKMALIQAQESAAIQILLEACLPTELEKEDASYEIQSTLREIQCKVCCFIHQCFISAPNMAKLIHFQGYPPSLLSLTVPGIPSMHICLDFVPQLLNQPHLEKQLFAIQLASHLALQYPIPKSYSISKYIIDRLNNLLVALPAVKRNQLFVPSLKCLVRIGEAFPPLRQDITELILKINKVATSQQDKSSLVTAFQDHQIQNTSDISTDEALDVNFDENKSEMGECKPFNIDNNSLMGDNPAYNRETFLKTFSTKELVKEADVMFQEITKLSLHDKLVVVGKT